MLINISFQYYGEKKSLYHETEVALELRYQFILHLLNDSTDNLSAMATLMASSAEVQKNMFEGHPKELKNTAQHLYTASNQDMSISQLNFYSVSDSLLLSLQVIPQNDNHHLSEGKVDLPPRNKPKTGLNTTGSHLAISGVAPIAYEGKPTGLIEVISEVRPSFLKSIKTSQEFHTSIIIPNGEEYLCLETGQCLHSTPDKYPFLTKVFEKGETEIIHFSHEGSKHFSWLGPLKDQADTTIAVVAISRKLDPLIWDLTQGLLKSILMGIATVILLLFTIYYLIEKLINVPIIELVEVFKKAGEGDLTQRANTQTVNCSAITGCEQKKCVMYNRKGHCWEEAGSLAFDIQCPKIKNGVYQSCTECESVYQQVFSNEINQLSNYFNSFMIKFEAIINNIYGHNKILAKSSINLAAISQEMSSTVEQTAYKTKNVTQEAEEMSLTMESTATATEIASDNVKSAAASVRQITNDIQQVANNLEKARNIAGEAVQSADTVSETVGKLGDSAEEIDAVTETINEISEQTKLLALNSTIEAARAGEAGKGFAVVANEIKNLARQTADATNDIKNKIIGIQQSTDGTVSQIDQISKIINSMNEIVTNVAIRVEEQSSITMDIAENVDSASNGIQDITNNISQHSKVATVVTKNFADVNLATNEMTNSSIQVRTNAENLSRMVEELDQIIDQFKR